MKEVELIAQASEELERQGFVQEDFYLSEPLAKAFLKAQVCRRTNRDSCNVSSATEEDEKCVVSRLSSAKDMGVFTMRLQYSLENTLIQVKQLADNAKENKRQKHATILREILEMQDLKKEKNRLALYKLIFKLLLVEEDQEVDRIGERSIATALQSALAEDDIPSYERSSLDIRKQTIERLPFLVLGVRLYTQRDNAQFENSRDVCFEEFEALLKDLEQEISFEKKRMKNYKQVLDFEFCNPGSISSSIKELHDELTNRQQYFTYLLQLQDRTQKEFECVESLSEKYDRSMKKLTLTIGNQMSIPKEQVFPMFFALGEFWTSFRQSVAFCQRQLQIFNHLLVFKNHFNSSLCKSDVQLASEHSSPASLQITIPQDNCEELYYIPSQQLDKTENIVLEWQAFCIPTCLDRNGLVLRSDFSLGVICNRGLYYSFATQSAMINFSKNPEYYINGLDTLVVEYPYLVSLFGLSGQLSGLSFPTRVVEKPTPYTLQSRQSSKTASVGINTPTHIVEKYIDYDYRWNEWDMRRDALKWTNLQRKKTHSSQTEVSHFRRDAETQDNVKLPIMEDGKLVMPGTGSQTMRETGTRMPKTKRYFGHKATITTLTLDWDNEK